MAKELTVNDLLKLAQLQVLKGNGDKKVMISDDDEGNGYHALFYQFTEIDNYEDFNYCGTPWGFDETNYKDWITLG